MPSNEILVAIAGFIAQLSLQFLRAYGDFDEEYNVVASLHVQHVVYTILLLFFSRRAQGTYYLSSKVFQLSYNVLFRLVRRDPAAVSDEPYCRHHDIIYQTERPDLSFEYIKLLYS